VLSISFPIPSFLFAALIATGLAIATFYNYLAVDLQASQERASPLATNLVYLWMLVRWGGGLLLIFSGFLSQSPEDLDKVLWVLLWMMPPAPTSPALSLLWGGNLYTSAIASTVLSIITPLALISTFTVFSLPINIKELNFFYLILGVGLGIPALIAQVWRTKSPIHAHHHHHKWKFLGIVAVMLTSYIIGFQFTPVTLISDIFLSIESTRTIACFQQLILALMTFILIRVLAAMTSFIAKQWLTAAEAQDIYILLINPNFLLWIALFGGVGTMTNSISLEYGIFWASLGFYCIPFIDQLMLVKSFTRELLKECLIHSQRVSGDFKRDFLQLDLTDVPTNSRETRCI
jgi:2,3-bisphosphoglycerate-dependent phosphoglycerate mutase